MKALYIFCVLLPLVGFFIAIGFWAFKREDKADKILFSCFVGLFVNILVLLPLTLILRAMFQG
jgi:hypothetical protein